VVPLESASGQRVASLLIDMPLEVDYRVNNRFLKSTSLADRFSRGQVARVGFGYYPPTGNLPDRLDRFRTQREQVRAKRERMLAAAREQRESPADEATDTTLATPRPSRRDSVLSYFEFPENVEPEGEIAGDVNSGLQGRVLIRSLVGNPLLNITAVSHPFSHYAGVRGARRVLWAKVFALAALLSMFVQAMRRLRTAAGPAARLTLVRASLFASFMVLLRYALLSFDTGAARSKLFDPSVFATPTLGGLLRSTFDLALTGLLFVATLYGLVRIVRGDAGATPTPAGERRPAWRLGLEALMIAGVALGVCELARRFTNTVVVNANPRLLGESMALTDVNVLILHLGIFLVVTGILLAGMFTIWGAFRWMRAPRRGLACLLGLAVVGVVCVVLRRWDPVVISALVLFFVVYAPRVAHREDLVSVGIAAFGLVIVTSAAAYVYLSRDYDQLRKGFVLEKSSEVNNPADNWKVVILEDVLGDYAQRHEIRQALYSPSAPGVERLAFDLWADSPLSLLGYSCAIHVVTADDNMVSEFSVDMPYRVRLGEGGERTDTPDGNEWAVLDLTRSTPQGEVRFYRGVLNVDEGDAFGDSPASRVLGKVVVDVPFFFESLELAARTGPRTPEVLRNVQEGGVAPRVEEPEALLLARIGRDRRVMESSSERLAVGSRVPEETLARALEQEWPVVHSDSRSYRVVAVETPDAAETLLAGFVVPSPARHLLRWSTLLSLYLFFTLVILVMVVALGAVPRLSDVLPTLTPGRRLGFQQKLLASFLVVALVPAVILGLFSVDFIKERFVEEGRDEASYKVFSARKALVNLLHGELQFFLGRSDVESLLAPNTPAIRNLGGGRVAVLVEARLEEPRAESDEPGLAVAGAIGEVSTEDLMVAHVNGTDYLGVFSAPLRVTGDGRSGSYYFYYARAIDASLLSEIAEQVGADVNIYSDGELVASSREGLLAGGFISSSMNSDAFVEVSLLGSDRTLVTERAGSYDFQVAYLPLDRWSNEPSPTASAATAAWRPAPTRAALAVPLLFRPESYSLEIQRATSVVLGVFALLLAATIALGLVVARGVFEPLRELVAGTRRISRGDFNVRLTEKRSDEVGLVASAFNEMTERIAESQRALEERRRYLEAILANIGAGVASTDASGRVRTVNAAAERITGITAAEAAERTARELATRSRVFALFEPGEDASAFDSGELEVDHAGRPATVKFMRARLEAEGRYFGTVLVFEDVTELIQSKKLSAWVEMARQIAHEIKNPLTPIRISTQFMRRAYEQKPADFERAFKEGTETILRQVDVLKRIASEFSSYGRMQQLHIKPQPVDALVRGIVHPYEQNTSGIRVVYEDGASNARVMADGEAVRKICSNLIENAMEAMGSKGGELRVHCAETTNDGAPAIRITFRDTGPGLSDEVSRRLFEPYFSTKTTGTGLGLAICRTLSREMGGDVTVENVAGGVEAALTLRRA
jgi:PAS domain S-box-containing protein